MPDEKLWPTCPHCQRHPIVERCEPWPRNLGPAPWYVGCYSQSPVEHFVGCSVDTLVEVPKAWRAAAMSADIQLNG